MKKRIANNVADFEKYAAIREVCPVGSERSLDELVEILGMGKESIRARIYRMPGEFQLVNVGWKQYKYRRVANAVVCSTIAPDAPPAYTFDALPSWMQSFPVPHQVSGRVHSLSWED